MNAAAPSYGFSLRALRRWRDECVTLAPREDGATDIFFRLEGSTCGNIPIPLVYQVVVGPTADGYPLRELRLAPASGADGHRQMCTAKAGPEAWQRTFEDVPPLLGRPLSECLAWDPPTTPEGCLCAQTARAHKWRAVLQTVHYALHPPS